MIISFTEEKRLRNTYITHVTLLTSCVIIRSNCCPQTLQITGAFPVVVEEFWPALLRRMALIKPH